MSAAMWLMLCIVVLLAALVLAAWGAAWVLAEAEGRMGGPSGYTDE